MLQHPDPTGGERLLPAQLRAIDRTLRPGISCLPHICPSDCHISPSSSPSSSLSTSLAGDVLHAGPFLCHGTHHLSGHGKTIPALPKQSFLQRDTRKVRSLRGVFCCCWSGRAVGVEGLRGMDMACPAPTAAPRGCTRVTAVEQIPDALPSHCLFPARRAVFAFPFPPVSSMASEMGPWRGFAPSPPCCRGTLASPML